MDQFWTLFAQSTIVQALVTLVLIGTDCYLYATQKPVPPELLQTTMVVVGFWFGTKAQQIITTNRSQTATKQ